MCDWEIFGMNKFEALYGTRAIKILSTLQALLWLVLGLLANPVSASYTTQTPMSPEEAADLCLTENTSPWAPGAQMATPGLWWRERNRGGSSWDLIWSDDRTKLKVILYTYTEQGRPIWFASKMTALDGVDKTQWVASLYKYAPPGVEQPPVGSLAIRFFPNDPTRLVMKWDWDNLRIINEGPQKDCLANFIQVSPGRQATESTTASGGSEITSGYSGVLVNQLFSGYWNAVGSGNPDAVPGVSMGIYQSTFPADPNTAPGQFVEQDVLLTFDAAAQPVWLIFVMPEPTCRGMPCDAPPLTSGEGRLVYVQPNPDRYPHGIPTDNCEAAYNDARPCQKLQDVGKVFRNITDNAGTKGNIKITNLTNPPLNLFDTSPGQVLKSSNFFPSDGVQTSISKITSSTGIRPVQYSCTVGTGKETCEIWVAWHSAGNGPTPWRHNLGDSTYVRLSTTFTGEVIDHLRPNDRIAYELWSGGGNGSTPSGTLIDKSAEVRAYGSRVDNGDSNSGHEASPVTPPAFADPGSNLASDLVGVIAGDFRVDEGGNANYRIPLVVAPGAGGLAPSLALTYNNSAGMGYFGTGFSLEGASSIVPCRPGREFGDSDGPTSTASVFCLDGQRLLLQSGNDRKLGAVYRAEIETFQKVVIESVDSINVSGSTLKTFTFAVYGKDGSIRKYGDQGGTVASSSLGGVAAVAWMQTSLKDAASNTIAYTYSPISTSGERYLDTISYTGGRIKLNYTSRGGVDVSYASVLADSSPVQGRMQRSQIAKSIEVWGDAGLLRSYKFEYEDPLGLGGGNIRPRMIEVKECADLQHAQCYPATTFEWSDYGLARQSSESKTSNKFFDIQAYKLGDFNGDHRADVIWIDSRHMLHVSYSGPSGAAGLDFSESVGNLIGIATLPASANYDALWEVMDLDGDGLDDVLYAEISGGTLQWKVRYGELTNIQGMIIPGFSAPQPLIAEGGSITLPDDPVQGMSAPIDGGEFEAVALGGSSMLADFNGDGLPDLLYAGPNDTTYHIALQSRNPQRQRPLAFDKQYPVVFSKNGTACDIADITLGSADAVRSQAIDLDGDGRADVYFMIDNNRLCGELDPEVTPIVPEPQVAPADLIDREAPAARAHPYVLKTFRSTGLQGDTFHFEMYNGLHANTVLNGESVGNVLGRMRLIDLNGDGLVDFVYRADGDKAWRYMIAGEPGGVAHCIASCTLRSSTSSDAGSENVDAQVQLLDLDGDGKVDFWFPTNKNSSGSYNPYRVFLWKGDGFAQTAVTLGSDAGGNQDWMRVAGDFDGDGIPDFMIVKRKEGGRWFADRTKSHHQPRNLITTIANGFEAKTEITYVPMTYSSVYRRDYDAPRVQSGYGSVVFDVASPNTVVRAVQSSAPRHGYPNDKSVVEYFYEGLKVQAGGRGSLGFRRVSSYDYQSGVQVDTTYSNRFPTIGVATRTETRLVLNFMNNVCADADSVDCMPRCAGSGSVACGSFPTAPGTLLRSVADTWMWRRQPNDLIDNRFLALVGGEWGPPATTPSTSPRANTFITRTTANTRNFDLNGVSLGSDATAFDSTKFDDFGNPKRSTITKSGSDITLTTESEFIYRNFPESWKLARLEKATTLNRRSTGATNARRSAFTYDASGRLASETVEGMTGSTLDSLTLDGAARTVTTYHGYGDFGNRTGTFTCSSEVPETTCRDLSPGSSSYSFHPPTSGRGITRYARSQYDDLGRHVDVVYEGFSNGPGDVSIEREVSRVKSRTAGGDSLEEVDANGVVTQTRYGVMGRKRYVWSSTGASARIDYARCIGGSTCPANLAFVETTQTSGAPTVKVFYDILGREVLKLTSGFAGEWIAVMTAYDKYGHADRKTQPYFAMNSTAKADTPATGSAIYWNITEFDALARPVIVKQADGGVIRYDYDGLKTKTTLPTNDNGHVQTKEEVRDGAGNVISVTDANGQIVTYTYDGYGQVTDVYRGAQNTHTEYDTLGRKKSTRDPDTGTWTYYADDLGQVRQQVSPRNKCTEMRHDARGRMWQRSDFDNATCTGSAHTVSEWQFDTASQGIGKLDVESTTVGGVPKVTRRLSYNGLGQPSQVKTKLDGKDYIEQTNYDQYGRLFQTFFTAPGLPTTGELYEYNGFGYQHRLRSAFPGTSGMIYYEAQAMDAYGHVTAEYRTSMARLLTERTYDPQTGRLKRIVSGGGLAQDLSYGYDKLGNVTFRHDQTGAGDFGGGRNLYEQFTYDKLQRLAGSSMTTGLPYSPSLTVGYDPDGNIKHKYVTGNNAIPYTYGKLESACNGLSGAVTPGPHAVSAVGTSQYYCYDVGGNVIKATSATDGDRTFAYTPYDLLSTLTWGVGTGGRKVGYEYGPNREKIRRLDYANASAATSPEVTHFVGGAEVRWYSTYLREVRRYLGPLLIVQSGSGASYKVERQYFLTDAQGSTFAVLTDWGMPVNAAAAMSFDPFGARRDPAGGRSTYWSGTLQANLDASTRRGYTGHEQADGFGVIHMNGRIYDPALGRFLQADPYVQDPLNLQSLNRYSYVLNNPLAYTDPSGYWGRRQQGYLRLAGAIAISVWTGGQSLVAAGAGAWGQASAIAFMGGFTAGAVQSGSGKGALAGGVTSLAFLGVNYMYAGNGLALMNSGGKLTAEGYAMRALTAGAAGGVLASIQGQRFGSGFMSAGLGNALNPAIGSVSDNTYAQGFLAAIVGGTVSEVAGGKFANGAITAAFSFAIGRLFNGEDNVHAKRSRMKGSLSSPDDPFSDLSAVVKAAVALDVVRETCPAAYGCDVPGGFTIAKLGADISASANIYTGELTFNVDGFDFTKPYAASSILDAAYHETMHRGNSLITRWVDGNAEFYLFGTITANHQLIYDRSSELTGRNIGRYYEKLEVSRGGK